MQHTLKNRTVFCRDNLEVLRGIDSGTVDLIYLDPPFNKKKQFTSPIGSSAEGASFKDYWGLADIKNSWIEILKEKHPKISNFLSTTGAIGHKSNKYYLTYMAVRLIEIHRVLKSTGSVYLHCDQTMSHYLKLLMDCVFGHQNFRNEIVWRRQIVRGRKTAAKYMARNTDFLLFYGKSNDTVWNKIEKENFISIEEAEKKYKQDEKGFFRTSHRGTYSDKSIIRLAKENRIYVSRGGQLIINDEKVSTTKGSIEIKYYRELIRKKVKEVIVVDNLWEDISGMGIKPQEYKGYPTQKPVPLLERIIEASTHEGDLVLDPFCGCATTCVAAERLNRQWVGIDVSKKAYDLVQERLTKEVQWGNLPMYKGKTAFSDKHLIYREDVPARTDIDMKPLTGKYKAEVKKKLYGEQGGYCGICDKHFEIIHLEIDHIYPKSKGGGDNFSNLMLLCGHCNKRKSDKELAEAKSIIQTKSNRI